MIHERQNQSGHDQQSPTMYSARRIPWHISADTYKDFILTMLFLKYISDVAGSLRDIKNSMVMHQNSLKP
jgi:ATP/ADP translocase